MLGNETSINNLMQAGIQKIYKDDYKSQKFYIDEICTSIRHIKSDIVFQFSGFFVPNQQYLLNYLGEDALRPNYGLYNANGICLWDNSLVFPVTNAVGKIVGLAGYNPFVHLEVKESKNYILNYYKYSTKDVFVKGDYLFCLQGTYRKALEENYLIITDGIFDTLAFTAAGYLSAALLGSSVNNTLAAQLRFVDRIIVACDNDEAGEELFRKISSRHNGAVFLKQGKTKDADEILRTEDRENYLKALDECIKSKIPLSKNLSVAHYFSK